MSELLVATHNLPKKEEIQQILGSQFTVKSLTDYDLHDEITEDGDTFAANALIKAKYCFGKTGIPSLGDDSGLAVNALQGRPGIFSARYAGDHDFEKNIAKVLQEMEGITDRTAYFITVLCYYDGHSAQYFEGKVSGSLLKENSGFKGFGYDPIFVPDGHTRSFAEMETEEKNSISHRRIALDAFLNFIAKNQTS